MRETFRPAFCNELVKRQDKNCARPHRLLTVTRNRLLATLARDVPSLSEATERPATHPQARAVPVDARYT